MGRIFFVILILISITELVSAKEKEKSRLRFLVGSGSISDYNRQSTNNASDIFSFSNSTDYNISASGGEIHYIFSIGIGIIFSVSNAVAEYTTGEVKLDIGSSLFDISYLFGDEITMQIGLGLSGNSEIDEFSIYGIDYSGKFEYNAKKCVTYFLN